MREVNTEEIRKTVKDLFLKINYDIGSDVIAALKKGLETEESETGRAVLEKITKELLMSRLQFAKTRGFR
jgi:tartrate dehydratase alpha subunit/fumarate hydratase class I-like protein